MTDTTNNVPSHVAAAAFDAARKVVDDWYRSQGIGTPRRLTDAEKLDRCRQFDQTKMPAWRDPRAA